MSISTQQPPWHGHALAVLACLMTAALSRLLSPWLDQANIVMLFLLTVLLVARYLGRAPAVVAAFVSVALFDFFFVPPQLSFSVSDAQYLVTFAVMLLTALVTGTLTSGLMRKAEEARVRERRTLAMFDMARELAGALSVDQVAESARSFLRQAVGADGTVLLLNRAEQLLPLTSDSPQAEMHLALMALQDDKPIDCATVAESGYATAYFALRAPTRMRGVLAVAATGSALDLLRQQRPLIEAAASLLAIALERLHYVEAAQTAEIAANAERLRASLLAAISHDLRTPLTALRGMAETLIMQPENLQELAAVMRDQALRLSRMVENLLEMARLQAGKVVLRKEWQTLEELIGSSLKLLESALNGRRVHLAVPDDLPLLEFDAVLIERVLCNLIENADKYSPPGRELVIAAELRPPFLEVRVIDHGPGFVPGQEETVFALFERGTVESTQSGVGLGLAICRAIVEAHGGTIEARNQPEGGACVSFALPLGEPPELIEESEICRENRDG